MVQPQFAGLSRLGDDSAFAVMNVSKQLSLATDRPGFVNTGVVGPIFDRVGLFRPPFDWGNIGHIVFPVFSQPREQLTVPVSPVPAPVADTLFEDPDPNSSTRYYLPEYRLAEQTLDGRSKYLVDLVQIDATQSRLTVQLTAAPRAGGTTPLAGDVTAILRFVSGMSEEEVQLTVVQDGAGYTVTRDIATNNERDELYRALADGQQRTTLRIRHTCTVGIPIDGGMYRPSTVTVDVDIDRVPFEFAPTQHPYIYEGITNVGAGGPSVIDRTVEYQGRTHHYFQSAARPDEFAYLPDAFKVVRRDGPVRGPSVTVRFTSDDGSLEHTRASIEYAAVPTVDADRLAAATGALRQFVPVPAGSPEPTPALHLLVVADVAQLNLQLALPATSPGAPPLVARPGVVTSLSDPFRDLLTDVPLPAFQQLFDALFGKSDVLFSGQLHVAGGDGRPEVIVPFIARVKELAGEVFESADQQGEPGGVRVKLINRAESPVLVPALPTRVVVEGSTLDAAVAELSLDGAAATFPVTVPAGSNLAVHATVAGSVPPAIRREVRRGDRGPDVVALQNALRARGANIAADGIFGPKTEAAVRDFQNGNGLAVTGVADAATLTQLGVTNTGQAGAVQGVVFDLSGVRPVPATDAVWNSIVDPSVPAVYTRNIQVISLDSSFTPTTDVQLMVLDFAAGGSVTLRPGHLEGSADVRVPLADVVLRRGSDGTYSYTQLTVRPTGQVRKDKTDILDVLVPTADA